MKGGRVEGARKSRTEGVHFGERVPVKSLEGTRGLFVKQAEVIRPNTIRNGLGGTVGKGSSPRCKRVSCRRLQDREGVLLVTQGGGLEVGK